MLSFSRLDNLPRSAKTAILVVSDSLIAAVAIWFTVLLRAGGIPVLPRGLYVAIATVLVMLLVPTVAIVCGYYRLVLRFGTPTLVARSALVSGISSLMLGGIGWYGGATLMYALGLGAVFALVLFSEFVLSRAFARFVLTRNGSRGQGTVVAIYGEGAAGRLQGSAMSRFLEKAGINRIAAIVWNIFGLPLLLLMVSCGGSGGGGGNAVSPPVVLPPSLNGRITINSVISSNNTGASYQVSVYLPADYATTTDSLPIIYALDGGVDNGDRFLNMAKITEQQGVRAVLIGIGGYARRETDYRLPGASNFYAFVTTELIPFIESKYRIDPGTRTLAGHSYGGFFTVAALLMDRPDHRYFANYISQETSTYDQEAPLFEMEQQLFIDSAGNLPGTTLILSGDVLANDAWVERVYQRFLARNYQGLKLERIPAYSLGHMEMFEPSFRESIRLLFESSNILVADLTIRWSPVPLSKYRPSVVVLATG